MRTIQRGPAWFGSGPDPSDDLPAPRILTALLLTIGLVAGASGSALAAKPSNPTKSSFAAPTAVYDFADAVLDPDGLLCVFNITWSHPDPSSVEVFAVAPSSQEPATLGKKVSSYGTSLPGDETSIRVSIPATAESYSAYVAAKSTNGKWSAWTHWHFESGSPC